jgi:hypothetical protein
MCEPFDKGEVGPQVIHKPVESLAARKSLVTDGFEMAS